MNPIPPTPPPPPPKGLLNTSFPPGSPSFHSHSEREDVCPMEETPLIGSRTKKRPSRTQQMPYSSIPEVTSTLTLGPDEDDDDLSARSTSTTSSVSSFSTVSSLAENFKESLLLPFTDEDGTNVGRGLAALSAIGTTVGLGAAMTNLHNRFQDYLSSVCGYNYLILWSVCFYPQAIQNYRRQSTHGVSHDFALLNLMGWLYYSIYMASLFFQPSIRQLYEQRFHEKSTVQLNDVLFSTHALLLSIVYVLQILYYGRKQRSKKQQSTFACPTLKLKNITKLLVLAMGLPTILMPILILSNRSGNWLDYLYMLSFFKIACTLTKYSKQAYFNYKRQSTKGWNIWYNFLEASGGSLSMIQLVLDAKDMSGITGNLAKFLLGFATIVFDGIFFTQHYVWYAEDRRHVEEDDDDNEDPGQPTKKIPKHLRASSRFEIVIPPADVSLDDTDLHLGMVEEATNPKLLVHAPSDMSLDSISRTSEGILRL